MYFKIEWRKIEQPQTFISLILGLQCKPVLDKDLFVVYSYKLVCIANLVFYESREENKL